MRFTSQMNLALNEAQKAALAGEVPVGAVIVDAGGQVFGAPLATARAAIVILPPMPRFWP